MSKLESVARHNPERIKAVETQTGLQLDTGQGRGVNGGKRLKMVSSASLTVYESFIEILRPPPATAAGPHSINHG